MESKIRRYVQQFMEPVHGRHTEMNAKALFIDGDLGATLRAHLEKVRRSIDEIPESRFGAADPSDLATELFEDDRVAPIELTEGAISVEAQDADIDRRRFRDIDHGFPGAPPKLRGTRVIYNVPYAGDSSLFTLKPSRRSSALPRAVHKPSELRFVYEVRSSEVAETRAMFERDLSLTKQYVGWSSEEVVRFNDELQKAVESAVDARTNRRAQAAEGLAALGLPVRTAEPARVRTAPSARAGRTAQNSTSDSYDVALSFAGEDREYVEAVAEYLRGADVQVFYDRFETASLWGKDLVAHLQEIYQDRARFCVIFVSEHYVQKPWPNHERRSAQARALVADEEYLLPARFDDTPLPGLPPTVGFVDLRGLEPSEFGSLILRKLAR